MSNVIDFSKFKTVKELQEYANKQYDTIAKLQVEAELNKSKIEHLENLLNNAGNVQPIASNELELCKLEINRLYQHALREPLDDKQIRAFDVYVKNLLAIQNKAIPEKPKKKEPQLTPEELIAIALEQMPETDGQ
jgi:hypothetical protein